MRKSLIAGPSTALAFLAGCATVTHGDKGEEASLKRFEPSPGRSSLYVCREAAAVAGASVKATVIVDGAPIGTLSPNDFAHAMLQPGSHEVFIRRTTIGSSNSGKLTIEAKPGDIQFVWVGVTGGGFGMLTVDRFDGVSKAIACVQGAAYAVRSDD